MSAIALDNATKVSTAIKKKLGDKYVTYVRLLENDQLSYIEIGARLSTDTHENEVQAAYSVAYFEEMNTLELMQQRGRRILKDLQMGLGLEPAE